MSNVGGVGVKARHFSDEEEMTLRRDESTQQIVKRDAKTGADVTGMDRTWRETKDEQLSDVGWGGAGSIGHAAIEGAELAGLLHLGAMGPIGGAALALGLGAHELHEAHEKGHEQSVALARDNAHVALIGALDLPEGYKAARLDGDYKHVTKESGSPAFKMTEGLLANANKKDLATLQLHADRGMNAARDLARSGVSQEAFLKANPRVAAQYARDPAFREGFDAYRYAKEHLPAGDLKAVDAKLNERDGWYAQSHVSFRV